MRTRIGAGVVVVLMLGGFITAQSAANITGTVKDPAGTPLAGVKITLLTSPVRSTVTNARGEFSFAKVPLGTYTIRCELAGFDAQLVPVNVNPGSLRVEVKMTVTGLAETIPVESKNARANERKSAALGGITGIFAGDMAGTPAVAGSPTTDGEYARRQGRFNTEAYDHIDENGFRNVATDPLSTFSIDVDTASYANTRRFLTRGTVPPAGAVRIEEFINYFHFDYPQPAPGAPFSITTELTACPWNPKHQLALIGLQGRNIEATKPAPRNLVFLIDVSGSMDMPDKLPLVQSAMQLLANILTERDRVAIVVYAGASGLALPSTQGDQKGIIRRAIADLRPGGSTNGAAGIRLAYEIARAHYVQGGVNRVVLATDGDFNVGVTSQDELVRLIEGERASGVFLSVLGVGTGNLKDSTMEKLADKGNGNYAYLDSLQEARKVLVHEAGSTLETIAKDVKIQIEFNPRVVGAYRLIGYENRVLRNEDFNNDQKDAGEIGAGHSVTALYEIVPPGETADGSSVDPLKYQRPVEPRPSASSNELATIKFRYKAPDGETSQLLTAVLQNRQQAMTMNIGFASAVAEFGMLLRESKDRGNASYDTVRQRAQRFRGEDPEGYRAEFIRLVDLAGSLRPGGRIGLRD